MSHTMQEYNSNVAVRHDDANQDYDDDDDRDSNGNWVYDSNNKKRVGQELEDYNASKKNRGNYRCSKCGQPKKGHVCPFQPHFRKRDDEDGGGDGPDAFDVETQVEMDPEMTVRMLDLDRQGYPESYIIDSNAHLIPSAPLGGISVSGFGGGGHHLEGDGVGDDDIEDNDDGNDELTGDHQDIHQLPPPRSMYAQQHPSMGAPLINSGGGHAGNPIDHDDSYSLRKMG